MPYGVSGDDDDDDEEQGKEEADSEVVGTERVQQILYICYQDLAYQSACYGFLS